MNVYAIVFWAFVAGSAAYGVYEWYREHKRIRAADTRRAEAKDLDSIEARLARVRDQLAAMEAELLGDNALWDAAIDFEMAARRRTS